MLLPNQRDVEYPSGSTMETNTNTTTISKLWLMFNIGSQGWPWIEIRTQASANQDHLKDKKQTNKQCTKKWENQINSIVSYICACATISKALYKQTIRLSSCLISLLTKEQAQHFCLKGKSSDWENDMEIYQNTSVTLESSIFARRTIAQENLGLFDAKEDSSPDASIAGEDGLAASFQSISIQACPPPLNTPGLALHLNLSSYPELHSISQRIF